jgi:uroporphyrinogen-III decarboxylase
MNDKQWKFLLKIINGEVTKELPTGFIIDSPWLPNWSGISLLDYFSSDELWFNANIKALTTFPDVLFLPGFWAEYGMCSEPSAFGAKCVFPPNEFPHACKIINSIDEADKIQVPNPKTDGLAPFILNRLKLNQSKMEKAGYKIRFSISRGPLNIAAFLMGTTEFLTSLMMEPEKTMKLLDKITTYLEEWHLLQQKSFPDIDGMLLLDDIIGFMGETEFCEFGLPLFKRLYQSDVSVKFLHNDADCMASVKYLPEMGVNLFNMGFQPSLNELKEVTNNEVTMLGNIPPRDVLASGTPDDVKKCVVDLKKSLTSADHVIYSCGGGMPPGVSTNNINAFISAVNSK